MSHSLDLKNANQIFNEAWDTLEAKYGRENLYLPAEIMWLGGAPGAGKGTNTEFIMQERSITAPPVVMSTLLDSPQMEEVKSRGQLVGDREVVTILLQELLKPVYTNGVVVDGFPRTMVQVECVKMLYQKMLMLQSEFDKTPLAPKFRRPIFRITVLFVRENTAVQRQMKRGREIQEHNRKVAEGSEGQELALRKTDLDDELARERYRVFMEHTFHALQSLRDSFHYHFIDASGPLEEVKRKIVGEFQYQSSLELAQDTHNTIRSIPICGTIVSHARQELVRRLDAYRDHQPELFSQVVSLIQQTIIPELRRHNAVGRARVRTTDLTLDRPLAVDMVVDILTERGFFPTADRIEQEIPVRVDPETHAIINATRKVWLFDIRFPTTHIRRGGH